MEPKLVLAYDRPADIGTLFSEYTRMLVTEDPAFAAYLELQNYDEELRHLEGKYGLPDGRPVGIRVVLCLCQHRQRCAVRFAGAGQEECHVLCQRPGTDGPGQLDALLRYGVFLRAAGAGRGVPADLVPAAVLL